MARPPQRPSRAPGGAERLEVPFDRRSWIALGLLVLALPLLLRGLGPRGLVVYVALWTLALPLLLPALRPTLRAELPGALFLFLSAAYADNLDDLLGVEQVVSLALVLVSLAYLGLRAADTRALARTPPVLLLAGFYVQEIASALWFHNDDPLRIIENRGSVLAALLVGAVMVRRSDDGRRLVLWLIVLAALVSLPVMLFEVANPDFLLFSFSGGPGPLRAGGLFGQANEVGIALDLAIAALLALHADGELSAGAAAPLAVGCALGLLACASRSALLIALALLGVRAWSGARRRAGRAPVASALLAAGVVLFALPAAGRALVAGGQRLEALGFEGVDRLNEVVLALSGSASELEDDDSGRLKVATAALQLSAERPLFGFGTGNFSVRASGDEIGAHVELLQIIGENGAVGLGLYLVVLAVLALTAARVRPPWRVGGLLLFGAWLLTHFDSHDLHRYRFMVLPLAYLSGLPRRPARRGGEDAGATALD